MLNVDKNNGRVNVFFLFFYTNTDFWMNYLLWCSKTNFIIESNVYSAKLWIFTNYVIIRLYFLLVHGS